MCVFLGPIAGHVGDGNFHCLMVLDPNDPDEVQRVHSFTERLARYFYLIPFSGVDLLRRLRGTGSTFCAYCQFCFVYQSISGLFLRMSSAIWRVYIDNDRHRF